jgi:very-short-patch-repair endonuclease
MDQLIAELAARQHGVFTRAQARAIGLSPSAIAHRLQAGRWVEITPRVYRLAGAPETERSTVSATVLSAGTPAVATGTTTLALHDVRSFTLIPPMVVAARRPHRLALPGVTETFLLLPSQRIVVDGIPTATVARALFDLAGTFGERRLARAVDAALAARKVTVPQIQTVVDELAERGRRGSPALRRILAERGKSYRPPTTDLESAFLELVLDSGLPVPERQATMTGTLGWIGSVDFLWRSPRVVVETDGGEFHDSVTDRQNDERRDRALELEGWTVLRFGWNDVIHRPTSVLHTVRRALAIAA